MLRSVLTRSSQDSTSTSLGIDPQQPTNGDACVRGLNLNQVQDNDFAAFNITWI